jgi:hypothetical protein
MTQHVFNFKFDDFECLAVRDTIDLLNPEFYFPSVPFADLLALSKQNNIPLSDQFDISSLLVKTSQNTILIDTGLPSALRPIQGC